MIILDENFPDSQRHLLQGWRVSFKQIAFDIGREGLKDEAFPYWAYGLGTSCRRKGTDQLVIINDSSSNEPRHPGKRQL